MNEYDLVVIGGGAGELVATREARRRKASVVIVQDGPVGRRPHVHRVYVFRPRHSSQQHRRCGRRNRRAGLWGGLIEPGAQRMRLVTAPAGNRQTRGRESIVCSHRSAAEMQS